MRSPQVWTPSQHHYGPGPLVLIKSCCPGRLVPVRGKSDPLLFSLFHSSLPWHVSAHVDFTCTHSANAPRPLSNYWTKNWTWEIVVDVDVVTRIRIRPKKKAPTYSRARTCTHAGMLLLQFCSPAVASRIHESEPFTLSLLNRLASVAWRCKSVPAVLRRRKKINQRNCLHQNYRETLKAWL